MEAGNLETLTKVSKKNWFILIAAYSAILSELLARQSSKARDDRGEPLANHATAGASPSEMVTVSPRC